MRGAMGGEAPPVREREGGRGGITCSSRSSKDALSSASLCSESTTKSDCAKVEQQPSGR